MTYTILVRDGTDPHSTTHISAQLTGELEVAKIMALEECMRDWGRGSTEGLVVLGVLRGDVEVVEWDDLS